MKIRAWKGLGGLVVAGLVVVWWVLESSGVAVVETKRPDGPVRRTHVWYVETPNGLWLEAGRPDHGWYRDIQKNPTLKFEAADLSGVYAAASMPEPKAHEYVRGLIAEKYGLRNTILEWVVNTSSAIAVRLDPVREPKKGFEHSESDPLFSRGP